MTKVATIIVTFVIGLASQALSLPPRAVVDDLSHVQIHRFSKFRLRSGFIRAQFVHERLRVVNVSQRFGDRGGIDRYGARLCVGVNAIEHERLNVAVKNNADEFVCFVHHRAAAVAADDVGVGNEIEIASPD